MLPDIRNSWYAARGQELITGAFVFLCYGFVGITTVIRRNHRHMLWLYVC